MPSGVKLNLEGKTFGRLTAIAASTPRITPNGTKRSMWRCRCECGNELDVWSVALTSGNTRSCGCLQRELTSQRAGRHRMSKTSTYSSWQAMMERCYNKNNKRYMQYGGRGIKVSERWKDFSAFLADMGERPPRNDD